MLKTIRAFLDGTSIVWKMAIGSAVSWDLAKLIGSKHPYLAPIAVILCLQVTIEDSIKRAYQRMIGTVIGVLLTAFIAPYLGVHAWRIGVIVLVAAGFAKFIKLDDSIVHQVGLSALLVLVFESQSRNYSVDRILETLIGAVVAVVINMVVFPPNFSKQAMASLLKYTDHLSDCCKHIGKWIEHDCPKDEGNSLKKEMEGLLEELHETMTNSEHALKSYRYNPFSQKNRTILKQYHQNFLSLRQGYTHLTNMIQTLMDWSLHEPLADTDKQVWMRQMATIAASIATWKQSHHANTQLTRVGSTAEVIGQGDCLHIKLPDGVEKYRYYLVLENDVSQLIRNFTA